MKPRFSAVSIMTLAALVLSLAPAAARPSSALAATCYQAQFVADVTVPDKTNFQPNAAFKKTWRLKNIGSCAWNNVTMVFDSGAQMGSVAAVSVTNGIAPGQAVDVSVDLTAPNAPGHYIGYWKFKNDKGTPFGIGANADKNWWVEINVVGTPTTNVAYDFVAKAGDAKWSNLAGALKFPGADGDVKGFALSGSKFVYEDNTTPQSSILVVPQNIANGYIQAEYPAFAVQKGDVFQTELGCEVSAKSCYVQFRLAYKIKDSDSPITIFQFNERWEGLRKPANVRPVNLDFLAGKNVKFILFMSAYGSPAGDRAMWGNPVITRQGSVPPPTATETPSTAVPTNTPAPITPTIPPSSCDKVQFIADVTVPDGSTYAPGAAFTKTWRLKNVGSCAWTTSYQLVFYNGEQMSALASAAFPRNVEVGQTIDISVNMTAPSAAGSYRGYWMFKNASGALFGIGAQANKPWWVDIKVSGSAATPGAPTKTPAPTSTPIAGGVTVTPAPGTAYDFAAEVCSATWFSGAGQLPCPGADGDKRGFVLKLSNGAKLESGSLDPRPSILTFPQNISSGYIQGFYPAFRVQNGDRFRSTISCENGSTLCYAAFRLDYESSPGQVSTFWGPFLERYEGQSFNVDVDLSALAGKDVKFALSVLAAGPATGDRALWVGPHIYRAVSGNSTLPDLNISAMSISFPNQSCFNPSDVLGVRVNITNSGQAPAGNFAVQSASEQQIVNGLAVGETKTLFFNGYSNPVSVTIDLANAVAESNEQNNSRSETLPVPTPPLPCSGSPTPNSTSTPDPTSGWNPFQNGKYKFGVRIPSNATATMSDNSGRADFPVADGTNLREKYLQITVTEGAAVCQYASGVATASGSVTINNVQFLKEEGSEGAAGSFYDWLSFSTAKNNACINFAFVLQSVNPGNLPTPPPVFDKAAEAVFFNQVINTFAFTP
ncbi:MAG: NBR1-Ig-like domain-containing protein [Anaerolineaceae bacterium]|nr:NBR1-Ig-like domain-containing protein [Anaerolineaceae bacterium]